MFINNKYKNWYYEIIANAKLRPLQSGYTENHHITPLSLGGSNNSENLITLTAREHFICHMLLTKFTSGSEKHKMIYAANMMLRMSRPYQHRYVPKSKIYEMLKREFGSMHLLNLTGRKLTNEHKANISAACKGRVVSLETIDKRRKASTGLIRTAEQRERMSKAQKGRPKKIYTEEQKNQISEKISLANKGKPKSVETRKKLSEALKGKLTGPRTEETKNKMRKPKSDAHRKAISEGRKAWYAANKS